VQEYGGLSSFGSYSRRKSRLSEGALSDRVCTMQRRQLQWVAGSAAAVVLLGGIAFGVAATRGDDADPAAADPTPHASVTAPEPTADAPTADASTAPAADAPTTGPVEGTDPADVVHVEDYSEAPPVALDQPADPGDKAVVSLTSITKIDGVGRAIGERSGPALAVAMTIRNDTGAPLDLNFVVVNVYSPSGVPSVELASDPHEKGYSGVLAPGESADATYVFREPAEGGPVKVTVSHDAAVPAASFQGDVTP
jgi:predicted component of type VI protein secretion system